MKRNEYVSSGEFIFSITTIISDLKILKENLSKEKEFTQSIDNLILKLSYLKNKISNNEIEMKNDLKGFSSSSPMASGDSGDVEKDEEAIKKLKKKIKNLEKTLEKVEIEKTNLLVQWDELEESIKNNLDDKKKSEREIQLEFLVENLEKKKIEMDQVMEKWEDHYKKKLKIKENELKKIKKKLTKNNLDFVAMMEKMKIEFDKKIDTVSQKLTLDHKEEINQMENRIMITSKKHEEEISKLEKKMSKMITNKNHEKEISKLEKIMSKMITNKKHEEEISKLEKKMSKMITKKYHEKEISKLEKKMSKMITKKELQEELQKVRNEYTEMNNELRSDLEKLEKLFLREKVCLLSWNILEFIGLIIFIQIIQKIKRSKKLLKTEKEKKLLGEESNLLKEINNNIHHNKNIYFPIIMKIVEYFNDIDKEKNSKKQKLFKNEMDLIKKLFMKEDFSKILKIVKYLKKNRNLFAHPFNFINEKYDVVPLKDNFHSGLEWIDEKLKDYKIVKKTNFSKNFSLNNFIKEADIEFQDENSIGVKKEIKKVGDIFKNVKNKMQEKEKGKK